MPQHWPPANLDKPYFAVLFLAAYAAYFLRETRSTGEHASTEGLEPLRLQRRRSTSARWAVLAQTAATLALIFAASQLFVKQLEGGWSRPRTPGGGCRAAVVPRSPPSSPRS